MLNSQKGECSSLQESEEHQFKEIVCYNLETELIKKQLISIKLKEDFIQRVQENKKFKKNTLVFYTDGLFKEFIKPDRSKDRQIGASWMQVNRKEEKILKKSFIDVQNWSMLTKTELLAIF